ncbi:MAG: DUF6265 family protein [Planctomycetota bacterium]
MRSALSSAAIAGGLVIVIGCVGFGVASHNQPPPSDVRSETDGVDSMGWLTGTWSGPMWGGQFTAYYSPPSEGKIIGYSTLEQDGEIGFYEFEVFETSVAGTRFSPFPGGRRADGFMLAGGRAVGDRAVFENPDKDFPTRVTYERVEPDRLVITLDDAHAGSDRRDVFDLRRR